MKADKTVFCDTSFLIRLLNADDPLHKNADGYFRYFLENGYSLHVSTVAIAEFCVRGALEELPLEKMRVSAFNIDHAALAGSCERELIDAGKRGTSADRPRSVVINDVMLMAQAQRESADCYITADTKSKVMYDTLSKAGMVSFEFIDLHEPHSERFGVLDMEEGE